MCQDDDEIAARLSKELADKLADRVDDEEFWKDMDNERPTEKELFGCEVGCSCCSNFDHAWNARMAEKKWTNWCEYCGQTERYAHYPCRSCFESKRMMDGHSACLACSGRLFCHVPALDPMDGEPPDNETSPGVSRCPTEVEMVTAMMENAA